MPHLIDCDVTGMVKPSAHLEQHDKVFLVSLLSTVNNGAVGYRICNFSELPYTITADTHLEYFNGLTLNNLIPCNLLTFQP